MKTNIYSDRLILRNIETTDIESIFSYRSLADVAKYQYWEPFTLEQTKDFVNKCSFVDKTSAGEWIGLAIIEKATDKLIGDCALKIDGHQAEMGCNISPTYQKKGFGKEALTALIDFCFNCRGISDIYGITDAENTASIKMMESVNMYRLMAFEENIICKGRESTEHKYVIGRSGRL